MKTLTAILMICLASTAHSASPKAEKISVYTGTWLIDFYPNGRASAQYGSNPGDSGYVDEGTIDFTVLLDGVNQAQKKNTREPADRFQIAIQLEGQTTTIGFVLTDDSFIERTLAELDEKWKQHPVGHRFFELKTKYPIIPKKEESSEPAGGAYVAPAVGAPSAHP